MSKSLLTVSKNLRKRQATNNPAVLVSRAMTRLPLPTLAAIAAGSALLVAAAIYWVAHGEAIILALANIVCL